MTLPIFTFFSFYFFVERRNFFSYDVETLHGLSMKVGLNDVLGLMASVASFNGFEAIICDFLIPLLFPHPLKYKVQTLHG